ncbi:ROK family protein [Spiroplasma endosymbiont of Crioceris asparagi]|uniref:ROK family protein n=1 Tax=Spiroplasma endosymbiont of Crioceris asparagi TaxID=3066286 RepID=UPI0030CD7BF2
MSKYVLSVDLGATTAKCCVFKNNEILKEFVVESGQKPNIVKRIFEKFNELNNFLKINKLEYICFAVCGVVDNKTGNVLLSVNLGWENYPLKKEIKTIFNVDNVFVLNDAKAAIYGEWSKSLNKEPTSMLMYTIGTGIGGAVIFDKKLVFGDNAFLASEPGHGGGFQNTNECSCKLSGCIEPISSATGIERILNEKAKTSHGELNKIYCSLNRTIKIIDIKDLFKKDDQETIEIFKYCLEPLAKQIAILTHVFDFSCIVVGGGPSQLGIKLVTIIKEHLKKYLLPDFFKKINLRISNIGNLAGAIGAFEFGKDNI